jgi:hypothetical protein
MKKALRIFILGVLIWIAGMAVSLIVWPFHESHFMLFKSIMVVAGNAIGIISFAYYFNRISSGFIKEGVAAGIVWFAVNILLDLIVLVCLLKMPLAEYLISPGIGYLNMPVMGIGIGYILSKKS